MGGVEEGCQWDIMGVPIWWRRRSAGVGTIMAMNSATFLEGGETI